MRVVHCILKYTILVLALSAAVPPAVAETGGFGRAVARIDRVLREVRKVEHGPPGLAVIMVVRGYEPVIRTYGVRSIESGEPFTANTPFYIASMSKSYTGLLAACLDRKGIFKLDSPLAAVWPDLKMAKGIDPSAITVRQWMVHEAPLANSTLGFRTAYVGPVGAKAFPGILSRYSSPRHGGFEYSNTGYLVYGAALETKTHRSFRAWFKRIVLDGLRLAHTATRSSAYPAGTMSSGHFWDGKTWRVFPPKPDALMHPAGDVVTTPRDMARWLIANMNESGGDIPHAPFVAAHTARQPTTKDRYGFKCDGYALGWYTCSYDAMRILSHGGGYTGVRSLETVSVGQGVGFAVFSNSDAGNLEFMTDLTKVFLDAWAGTKPRQSPPQFTAAFEKRFHARIANEAMQVKRIRAKPVWGGWRWHPSGMRLKRYAGTYRSPRLGDMVVTSTGNGLIAALGLMTFRLAPAKPDWFAAVAGDDDRPAPFHFMRGAGGALSALYWGSRKFRRVK